jgi:hypothetical protein
MGETARRIRILRELVASDHSPTFEELVARYGAHEIVDRRLERLIGAGQVACVDGRYVVVRRSIYLMAQLIGLAHWIVFGFRRSNRLEER